MPIAVAPPAHKTGRPEATVVTFAAKAGIPPMTVLQTTGFRVGHCDQNNPQSLSQGDRFGLF